MNVQREEFGTPGYLACLELRRVILREPLGLTWSEADLAHDENEQHFGLWDEGTLLACVSVRPLRDNSARLRQMAVVEERQRQGLGQHLLSSVIEQSKLAGIATLELHSRESAVPFYQRLEFVKTGASFEEVGLPHWKMALSLLQ